MNRFVLGVVLILLAIAIANDWFGLRVMVTDAYITVVEWVSARLYASFLENMPGTS